MKRLSRSHSFHPREQVRKISKTRSLQSLSSSAIFSAAWNAIDTSEERIALSDVQKLSEIEIVIESQLSSKKIEQLESMRYKLVQIMKTTDFPYVEDPNYNGPHLPNHLTLETVKELLEAWKLGQVLHPVYAMRIFSEITRHLSNNENTVNNIYIPPGCELVVVGDIHGQLDDLVTIFNMEGWPSEKKYYIFNGDIVDRGSHDVQLLLTIYCLKLVYPKYVWINRGNHEQRRMNERYSFEKNCRDLYRTSMVYELAQCSFIVLPLATIIDDRVFVTHGGLSKHEDVSLDEIRSIKRADIPRVPNSRLEEILECLLWSDPMEEEGFIENARGAGILWGPDLTHSFLDANSLNIMIRSHEMCYQGYEKWHDDRVLTIFSASKYCGRNDNKGAIAVFDTFTYTTDRFPRIETYVSQPFFAPQSKSVGSLCKEETLQLLREAIYSNRHLLSMEFETVDVDICGYILIEDWITCMNNVLDMPLNWNELLPFLADIEYSTQSIEYIKFLDRYKIIPDKDFWKAWEEGIAQKICKKIYNYFPCLKEAFSDFDTNSDQKLSYKEFLNVIKKLGLDFSDEQVYDFMRTVDINQDGHIDFHEFSTKFEAILNQITEFEVKRPLMEKIENQIHEIAMILHDSGQSLKNIFSQYDHNELGGLTYDDFIHVFKNDLKLNYSDEEYMLLARYVDADQSGIINWREFKKSFTLLPEKSHDMFTFVLKSLYEAIHTNKHQLRTIFYKMDIDGSGMVDLQEFTAGLNALRVLSDISIQEDQILALYNFIDTNNDGLISYEEFLNSFKVIDTKTYY